MRDPDDVVRRMIDEAVEPMTIAVDRSAAMLERYPCGITPLGSGVLEARINPERIVALGARLDDAQFDEFLLALSDWPPATAVSHVWNETPAHVVRDFFERAPTAAALLTLIARDHGYVLTEFLGAGNPPEPPL